MEPQTWFKWSEVSKAAPLKDGQVAIPDLCLRFRMEEDSLEIADMQVAWSRATGYSSNLPELRRRQSGDGTEENPIQVNGVPCAEDRALLTEFEFLGSALQTANLGRKLTTSLPSKIYLLQPAAVKKWEYLRPTDNGSGTLADAITRFRESANRSKRKYVQHHETFSTPVTNEAVVETLMTYNITHPLAIVAGSRGQQVEWRQQHCKKFEAEAVSKAVQDRLATACRSSNTAPAAKASPSGLQQATPAALAQNSFGRQIRSPTHTDPDQRGSDGSSEHIRCLVLVRELPAAAATEATASSSATTAAAIAASPEPKSLCVGGLTGVQVLMDIHGDVLDPIDLEQAWNDYNQSGGRSERSTAVYSSVSQLYTYMYSQGVCYGFISCYFGTWIANCPSSEPGTMYLSDCFRSSSRVPAETTRGALALLQDLALSTTDAFVVKVNDALDDSFLASGAGSDTNKEVCGREPSLSLEDDGANVPGSQDLWMPSQGKISGRLSSMHRNSDTQQGGSRINRSQIASSTASSSSPFPPLVLGDKLCLGYAGPVYKGKYQQSPAIVKMLSATEASYWQETYMYKVMQPKQGELVPRMLAAGRVMHGINFIAVERIDGVALSSLPSVSKAVGAAALAALRSLANAFPGFLHGDIRLQNVLLVADGNDTTPKCMWIDFGQSRLNGTRQQQLAEEARLKQLLGM